MARPIVIHADWDPEASVWVATTADLKGSLSPPYFLVATVIPAKTSA